MKKEKYTKLIKNLWLNARRLIRLATQTDKRITFFYYATTAVGASVPVVASVAIKIVIDNLQNAQSALTPTLPIVIIVTLGSYYLITIIEDVVFYGLNYSYFDFLFRYKLQNEISFRFYRKVTNLDIAHFENTETQDLITKTRDTMLWRVPDFLRNLRDLFGNIVAYISAFVITLPFGIWVPLLITFMTLPRIYLRAKHGSLQWSIYGSGAPQARKLWYIGHLLYQKTSIKEMKISQTAGAIMKKYKDTQNYLYKLNKGPLDKYLKVRNLPIVLETATLFTIATYFVPKTIDNTITIGSFTLLINLMTRLNNNAASSATRLGEIYENNLYVNHFFDVLGLPRLVKLAKKPKRVKSKKPPKIEFKNVSFNYPDGPKVLNNINLTINPGDSIAFVGDNGAGKSTLVKLICRFYDVTGGEILVNGINIKQLKLASWYKSLGTLFQEFTHYHFTVKENITLGAPEKDNDRLMKEAAKKAGADKFIERLPKKYEQPLGREFEDGLELSGGQWQKLAIARAFYEEPPVLILDEPTSAIDAEAEYEIFNNLQSQYKNKTLILVSHRFSTVRNANKIFVVENGGIIERGSHKQLIDLGGKYYKMFTVQAKGYK